MITPILRTHPDSCLVGITIREDHAITNESEVIAVPDNNSSRE